MGDAGEREACAAQLVDPGRVAARMGVLRATVHRWVERSHRGELHPPTPEPLLHVGQGVPVWWWPDWVAWAAEFRDGHYYQQARRFG